MTTLLETAADYLRDDDWNIEVDPDDNALRGTINGENVTLAWVVHAVENDDINSLRVYTTLPINIPVARRPVVAELLTRINNKIANGNFELDFSDGELRYSAILDIMDGVLTQAMFARLFMIGLQASDYYFPTIMGVVYAGTTPALALELLEQVGETVQ